MLFAKLILAPWLFLLRMLGFGNRGVEQNSLASNYQSVYYGGYTPADSWFASAQSTAMRYDSYGAIPAPRRHDEDLEENTPSRVESWISQFGLVLFIYVCLANLYDSPTLGEAFRPVMDQIFHLAIGILKFVLDIILYCNNLIHAHPGWTVLLCCVIYYEPHIISTPVMSVLECLGIVEAPRTLYPTYYLDSEDYPNAVERVKFLAGLLLAYSVIGIMFIGWPLIGAFVANSSK